MKRLKTLLEKRCKLATGGLLAAALALSTMTAPAWAVPGNPVVTSLADNVTAGDGACTLREAIANANAASDTTAGDCASGNGTDTITFDPSLVAGGSATISLTLFDTGQDPGELGPTAFIITSPRQITITGPTGNHGITVERNGAAANFRLFHVQVGASLTLQNLTLQNGVARGGNGAVGSGGGGAGLGGAILNEGTLAVSRCTLVNNSAVGGNGGSGGTNSSGGGGGGLAGDASGAAGGAGGGGNGGAAGQNGGNGGFGGGGGGGGLPPSSVSGRSGGGGGFGGGGGGGNGTNGGGSLGGFGAGTGGVGTSSLGNSVDGGGGGGLGGGGAIFSNAKATATLTNSTLSGNTAQGGNVGAPGPNAQPGTAGSGWGGAVMNRDGKVTIANSTLAGNRVAAGSGNSGSAVGGAVYNLFNPPTIGATLTLDNTILADTQGGSDAANNNGTVNGGRSNIVETNEATDPLPATVIIAGNGDPLLAALADNGGPTFTLALQPGSPAIDAGAAATCLATDQRGVTRPQGSGCDIGAYELVPNVPPVIASNNATVTVNEGQTATNSGTVSDANGDTVTLSASVGTVVNNGNGTWSWSFLTSDGPTQSQTVTITADDGHGGVSHTSFALIVNNVAPTITSVTNNGPVIVGNPATITVTATDPAGANDPLTYSFDCNNDGVFEIGPQAGNSATCTFASAGSYTVNVRVADDDGGVTLGSTVVTVNHVAPDCSHAVASPNLLWPPNHKFVPIQILGVTNQEGGAVAIKVTSIFQDEKVGSGTNGCDSGEEDDHGDKAAFLVRKDDGGDGNNRVDGKGVGTANASVRAERSCQGDGRVYHISFTATNAQGLTCTGAVTVGVARKKNVPPVDGGALYNSTIPAPNGGHGHDD